MQLHNVSKTFGAYKIRFWKQIYNKKQVRDEAWCLVRNNMCRTMIPAMVSSAWKLKTNVWRWNRSICSAIFFHLNKILFFLQYALFFWYSNNVGWVFNFLLEWLLFVSIYFIYCVTYLFIWFRDFMFYQTYFLIFYCYNENKLKGIIIVRIRQFPSNNLDVNLTGLFVKLSYYINRLMNNF